MGYASNDKVEREEREREREDRQVGGEGNQRKQRCEEGRRMRMEE